MKHDFDAEAQVINPTKSDAPQQALVGVIMGSQSDWPTMKPACDLLEQLEILFERFVLSAHRTPERALSYAQQAEDRGLQIIIAAAGAAAHLAGVTAANTNIPVIGVPLHSPTFNGLDALLSTLQMPAGIPVATVAVGSAGPKNAALLAARILALSHPHIAKNHAQYRHQLTLNALNQTPWNTPTT